MTDSFRSFVHILRNTALFLLGAFISIFFLRPHKGYGSRAYDSFFIDFQGKEKGRIRGLIG